MIMMLESYNHRVNVTKKKNDFKCSLIQRLRSIQQGKLS